MSGGVKIPVRLDKTQAEADAKELADELKKGMKDAQEFGLLASEAFEQFKAKLELALEVTKEAVKVAAQHEQAEVRAFAAIRQRSNFDREQFEFLKSQNEERRRAFGISDAEQLQIQGTASLLGVKAGQLDRVTKATIGLASITGQDLQSALTAVVKLYEGNTKGLQRMGIQVEGVGQGLDMLASKMDVAKEVSDTFSGRVEKLKSEFEKLLESLGKQIVENDDVKKFITDLTEYIRSLVEEVEQHGPEIKARISEFVAELRAFGSWVQEHKEDIKLMIDLFRTASTVKLAGSLINAGGKLVAGPGAALAARGVAAAGRAVAAGGLATETAIGIGAFTGIASLAALPDTNSDAVARALMRDQGIIPEDERTPVKHNQSFKTTGYLAGGYSNATFEARDEDDPDFQVTVSSEKVKADRAKAAAEAEKYREMRLRAFQADQENWHKAQKLHEKDVKEQEQREIELDVNARERKWKEHLKDVDLQRQIAEDAIAEKNRAALNGFESVDKLHEAEIMAGHKFADSEKQLYEERLHASAQFWSQMAGTAASGLGNFISEMVQGFLSGKGSLEDAAKKFLGGLLQTVGQSFISLGAGAVALGILGQTSPLLVGVTGGAATVAAGLGLVAAGGILAGAGAALSATASSGGASAGAHVGASAPTPSFGGASQFGGANPIGGGAGSGVVNFINVSVDGSRGMIIGNSAEVARYLADLLQGQQGLALA